MTAQEKAYKYVKAKIIDGSFKEGNFLTEGEITKFLNISRTPVREAFLRLEMEGVKDATRSHLEATVAILKEHVFA